MEALLARDEVHLLSALPLHQRFKFLLARPTLDQPHIVRPQALSCRTKEAWVEADVVERLHLFAKREAALLNV